MITPDIISVILNYTENVGVLDSESGPRRARILQQLQEVSDEVWHFREWQFTYGVGNVTLSTGVGALPADFLEFGTHGGLWIPASKTRLEEKFPNEIIDQREAGVTGTASQFALYSNTIYTNSVDATDELNMYYRIVPQILEDTSGHTPTIPAAYHNTVLVAGGIAKARMSKGDARDWDSRYREGLARMVNAERRRKTSTQYMPMAVNNW